MSEPETSKPHQFTIGGLMRDIAIAGVAFAGFVGKDSPLWATTALFAGAYFAAKFLYFLAIGPFDWYFRTPHREVESASTLFPNNSPRGELKAQIQAAWTAFQQERFQGMEGYADAVLRLNPNSLDGAFLLSLAFLVQGNAADARTILLDMLDDPSLNPKARPFVVNNLAWASYLLDDPELKAESDLLSADCLEAQPDMAPIKGTRGAVLVWIGQIDEGLALLRQAFDENTTDRNRACNACSMALGQIAKGNGLEARHMLDVARQLDPLCLLIPRVEAAITAAAY